MNKLTIILHNNKAQITGDRILINELRDMDEFKIRDPGFFWALKSGRTNGWDGYKRYITETGLIQAGLIPKLITILIQEKIKFGIIDKRDLFKDVTDITHVGDFELRPYQKEAVLAFLENKLVIGNKNLRWQRGILNEATNAGKNLIAAAIYSSFAGKRNGLFLINNKVIFNQAVVELTKLLGRDIVGSVSSIKTDWKKFNICMVQTLANRVKTVPQIKRDLANNDILIVDEGDEVIGRKDTRYILDHAYNAPVRLSLTGTSGLSKDKIKNQNEVAFFGPIIHKTTNKELVDQGYSAEPVIKIHMGNDDNYDEISWEEEYLECIVRNKNRNNKIWKRVTYNINRGRLPLLILFKFHEHAKYLMKVIPKVIKDSYRIGIAHGKIKNREYILKRFGDGKIDILLCSMIIRRGKNLPEMRTLINAAAGDSHANTLQIFGRLLRMAKDGKKKYLEDFYDEGKYIKRHGKHRIAYYKKQNFKVKELYK